MNFPLSPFKFASSVFQYKKSFLVVLRYVSYETKGKSITIPNRIHRKPTDILRALANAVQRDTNAPDYKYIDDPFLIPVSNQTKRTYALAKESGRKAARWIRDEHAELFQHKEADPFIQTYAPKIKHDDSSEVSHTNLFEKTVEGEVEDSINIYEILKSKNSEIPKETLQSFLELLCFYNSEEQLDEEWLEEQWFKQNYKQHEKKRKTWNDGSLAEEIFSLIGPNSQSISALIQGLCRFCHAKKAWEYYEKASQENISLDTETYNSLISVVNILCSGHEEKWNLIEEILRSMQNNSVGPNLNTFNSVLEITCKFMPQWSAKLKCMQIFKEMKKFNIEPSLGSYYLILLAYCREKGPVSTLLWSILEKLENKEFKILHLKDTHFFPTAMDLCCHHLQDINAAYKVDELLHTGNNYSLMGDSYKESIYYRNFFKLLCSSVTVQEVFNEYYKYVPNIYTPEPSIIQDLIQAIDAYGAIEYLPILWSDIVSFNQDKRQNIVECIMQTIVNNTVSLSDLKLKLQCLVTEIVNRIDDQDLTKTNNILYTSELMSNIIEAYINLDCYSKARQEFYKFRVSNELYLGMISANTIEKLAKFSLENQDQETKKACIQYCVENNYEHSTLLKETNT